MVAKTYDEALRRLLVHEGGYSNHPSDPGGPTNFGITIHDYRQYVKPGATAADVRAMTVGEAKAIYRSKYWDALRCDALPTGVDYCVFDYGVNSGIGRGAKVLQRVVGVAADGEIGAQTLAAVAQRQPMAVVEDICDERLRFLQGLKTWPVFGKGWGRRVAEVRAAARAMAEKAPVRSDRPTATVPGKGAVPINETARNTTAGGAAAAGGTAAAQSNEPGTVFVILVATILVAIGAWLFWRWWQKRQQDAPA
jgi:lysozyme family protein